MYIEVGPIGMSIKAERDAMPVELDISRLKNMLNSILRDIGESLPVLKQKAYRIKRTKGLMEIPRKMVEAVKIIDEKTLTPMAAVAGAVADGVKEALKADAIDFLSVNNGGDISLLTEQGRAVRIGLFEIKSGTPSPYTLKVEGIKEFGIATSGFGGRSFTLGIADMATVIGPTGAIADAAATFVCNMTNVKTNHVKRKKAREIDPMTDIPDEFVTVRIDGLTEEERHEALKNGLDAAESLKGRGAIYDAVIIIEREMVTTISGDKNIVLEV